MASPAWLWIREPVAARWDAAERALAEAGFVLGEVELDPTSDRGSLGRIESALGELIARPGVDARNLGVIGLGLGGTLALLAGCTSRRVRAVASIQPVLVFKDLSAARPFQPIELLLNLDVPMLALVDESDPRTPPEHVALFRRQCELGAKNVELERANLGRLDESLPRLVAFAADTLQ